MAELIVALDVASRGEAVEKVKAIGDAVGFYKIGLDTPTVTPGAITVSWSTIDV